MNPTGEAKQIAGMEGLHVLTLTPFYPSEGDEANGCFVAEPLPMLRQLGFVSTVIALQPFYRKKISALGLNKEAEWLRYFSLPGAMGLPFAGAFAFARIVGHVRQLHRSHRIDLIHAHAPLPCGHAAMLLSAEMGIPYIVSVHGLDAFSDRYASGLAARWCRRVSQRAYRFSRRVVCVSEHVREQVLEGMGRNCRTSVIYNGVDAELFSPANPAFDEQQLVLSVGNLIPIKGHDLLIRAVASLAGELPDLNLEIVGDGPERERLQTLAGQCQLSDRVRFPGRQSRHQVATAMQRCTVFALPSRYEGLGCVYLEAMSAAKPVIGCRDQGIAEIIRQGTNGFLVGPDNEKELTIALGMLLRDQNLRRNLGRAARDTILDRLTLAHHAEQMARIYRESLR